MNRFTPCSSIVYGGLQPGRERRGGAEGVGGELVAGAVVSTGAALGGSALGTGGGALGGGSGVTLATGSGSCPST